MNAFKPVFVEGRNIDEVWFKLLNEVYQHGRVNKIDSGSYAEVETRLEFDFVAGTIYKPIEYTEGGVRLPLAVTVPQGIPAPTTDAAIEEYFCKYLMDGNLEPNEHYRYSTWIVGGSYKLQLTSVESYYAFNHETKKIDEEINKETKDVRVMVPNQVEWIINHYKTKGLYNNHCYVQVGYPESNLSYDRPYTNEMERGTSPCLRGIDTKIVNEDGKNYLLMNVYYRSWDLYAGFPENMGGLALLQEYIASQLEVEVGTLSFCSKGLHAYSFQLDPLMARIGKK